METIIPDLWRANEEAERLFTIYLAKLNINDCHDRVIAACKQIRGYAARGPGRKAGMFTFWWEIDSLCAQGDSKKAWTRLRESEAIWYGNRTEPEYRRWSRGFDQSVSDLYAPLLYFQGKLRRGCALMERVLRFWLRHKSTRSVDLLHRVKNYGDREPRNRSEVTLSHFYRRLGRDLGSWPQWRTFVTRFHPKFFQLSGLSRDQLLADSKLLAPFEERLWDLVAARRTDGASDLSDLTVPVATLRQRQARSQKQRNKWERRHKPLRQRFDAKLVELFPELRELKY